jgi:hypothetical protein
MNMDDAKKRAADDFTRFWDEYRARTTQHRRLDIATDWWKLSLRYPHLTGSIAAGWARLDYLPAKAEPLIRDGVTPAMARQMSRHTIIDPGQIVDPRRVVRQQDPDDPDHEFITIIDL